MVVVVVHESLNAASTVDVTTGKLERSYVVVLAERAHIVIGKLFRDIWECLEDLALCTKFGPVAGDRPLAVDWLEDANSCRDIPHNLSENCDDHDDVERGRVCVADADDAIQDIQMWVHDRHCDG